MPGGYRILEPVETIPVFNHLRHEPFNYPLENSDDFFNYEFTATLPNYLKPSKRYEALKKQLEHEQIAKNALTAKFDSKSKLGDLEAKSSRVGGFESKSNFKIGDPLPTYNMSKRKNEILRQSEENLRLMQRIIDVKPVISRRKLEKEWIQSKSYGILASRYPHYWTAYKPKNEMNWMGPLDSERKSYSECLHHLPKISQEANYLDYNYSAVDNHPPVTNTKVNFQDDFIKQQPVKEHKRTKTKKKKQNTVVLEHKTTETDADFIGISKEKPIVLKEAKPAEVHRSRSRSQQVTPIEVKPVEVVEPVTLEPVETPVNLQDIIEYIDQNESEGEYELYYYGKVRNSTPLMKNEEKVILKEQPLIEPIELAEPSPRLQKRPIKSALKKSSSFSFGDEQQTNRSFKVGFENDKKPTMTNKTTSNKTKIKKSVPVVTTKATNTSSINVTNKSKKINQPDFLVENSLSQFKNPQVAASSSQSRLDEDLELIYYNKSRQGMRSSARHSAKRSMSNRISRNDRDRIHILYDDKRTNDNIHVIYNENSDDNIHVVFNDKNNEKIHVVYSDMYSHRDTNRSSRNESVDRMMMNDRINTGRSSKQKIKLKKIKATSNMSIKREA